MPDKIVSDLLNIKNLKCKLELLEKTGEYKIISHQMLDDIKSLDWAMNELTRIHFIPIVLCASNSLPAIQDIKTSTTILSLKDLTSDSPLETNTFKDLIILDGIAIFICIAPTKVEATVLRKYFMSENSCGTKMRIENHPSYLLCDGYELKDGLIYIEGSILNTYVEEIGKRGVKEQLSVWVRNLMGDKEQGEKI